MSSRVSVPKGPTRRFGAPEARIGRSKINLSKGHKTTFDAGDLIPVYLEDTLPGDTFVIDATILTRIFSPLDAPIMDDIECDIHFFWAPNRILWDSWDYFLGEHEDAAGAQDTTYAPPTISGTGAINDSNSGEILARYFGLPWGVIPNEFNINELPFRMYQQVYNHWFRDQNIIDPVTTYTNDADHDISIYGVYKSAKKHDYFTSALPYLQKGTASTAQAPVSGIAAADQLPSLTNDTVYETDATSSTTYSWAWTSTEISMEASAATSAFPQVYANLDINELRYAAAIQRLLEKDARAGTRPHELIRAHFGVTVPDYRAVIPEYLGGGKGYITVNPIANTSGVDSTASISGSDEFQGELRGVGVGTLRAKIAKSFVEHGWVMGIMRARGRVSYHQGIERKWLRDTKYDFYWPELSVLGEQPIYNRELWYQGDSTDNDVFGYAPRYEEYRFGKSIISGLFSSDATGTIDFWHLAEDFATQPSLNSTFIEDQTPMDRIRSTTTGPDFIADCWFNVQAARPVVANAVPSLMPRF